MVVSVQLVGGIPEYPPVSHEGKQSLLMWKLITIIILRVQKFPLSLALSIIYHVYNIFPSCQTCPPILFEPAKNGYTAVMDFLLQNGTDPNTASKVYMYRIYINKCI